MKDLTPMLDDFIASRRKRLQYTIDSINHTGEIHPGPGKRAAAVIEVPEMPDSLQPEELSPKKMQDYKEKMKAFFATRIIPKMFAGLERNLDRADPKAIADAMDIYDYRNRNKSGVNVNNFNLPANGRMMWSMEAAARRLVENQHQLPAAEKVIDAKAEEVPDGT